MVTPVGPQPLLGGVGEPGAAHDQAAGHLSPSAAGGVGAVGDLGLAVGGVVDVDPGVSAIAAIAAAMPLVLAAHGHRVAHVEPVQAWRSCRWTRTPSRPCTVICAGGAGAADPGDELVDEPAGAALGVGWPFAHPGVQHLAGVGPGGEQRVVAEHLGVAEPGALLVRCRRPRRSSSRCRSPTARRRGRHPAPTPARAPRPMTASSWRT